MPSLSLTAKGLVSKHLGWWWERLSSRKLVQESLEAWIKWPVKE